MRNVRVWIFIAFAVLLTHGMASADVLNWSASSGLTPDQVGYELINTSDTEVPVLSGGNLTISNDNASEIMRYGMSGSDLSFAGMTEVAFRLRYDSGSDLLDFRTGAGIAITTLPNVGLTMYVGQDEVFLTNSDGSRGPTNSAVDTDGGFHDYLIQVNGVASGSSVSVFQDGALILSGSTNTSFPNYGNVTRVSFGEFSTGEFGTSQWQSFSHNVSAVPEPSAGALVALIGFLMTRKRRRN